MASSKSNQQEPRIKEISITEDSLILDLVDGRTISAPLLWYPRLWHGTPKERQHIEIFGEGKYLHWPDLDEDLTVAGILEGHRSYEGPISLQKWLDSRNGQDKQTA
jgi:hypothetical protein